MRLRRTIASDVESLLAVQEEGSIRALAAVFCQETHPFPRDEIRRRWLSEVLDPETDVYVAVDEDGEVVGYAATRRHELLHFGIAVRTWGSGLADWMHDEMVPKLASGREPEARLCVFEGNHRARRFYERHAWYDSGGRSRSAFPPHPVLLEYHLKLLDS